MIFEFDQRKIRLAIAALVVIIVGLLIFYLGTHGRVIVENPGEKSLTIVKLESDGTHSDPIDIPNGSFISSGTYIVRNISEGSERFARVSVPRWLGNATINFGNNPAAKTTKLAALTYEHFFPADDGSLVSYSDLGGYAAGYTTHPANDAFGGNYSDTGFEDELTSPTITNSGQLLGIGHHDEKLERYSFGAKTFTDIAGADIQMPNRVESEEDVTLFPKIQRSNDVNSNQVGIYEKKKGLLKTVDGSGNVRSIQADINNSRSIVFDVNDSAWAAVEATTDQEGNAALEHEDISLSYAVNIHSLTGNKTTTISLGDASVINAIALSPSGEFVAVLKDGELWVYEVPSKKVVMVQPFAITNRIFWNNTKLYALTSDTGISVFDTKTNQLLPVSVTTAGHLSFSNATPLGSKLYVTAYNTKEDSELPDGYVIDLTQGSDNITEVLVKKLPYSGEDYDINFLGNTIYVRINYFPKNPSDPVEIKRIENIKKDASRKVQSLIGTDTLKKCTVTFVN